MHAPTLIIIGYPRLFLSEVEQAVERKYASEMHRVEIQFRNSATHVPHWLLQSDCPNCTSTWFAPFVTSQTIQDHHLLPQANLHHHHHHSWCCSYRCRFAMCRSRELQQPERFLSKCHVGGLVDLFIKDSLNHPGKKSKWSKCCPVVHYFFWFML